MPPPSTPSGAAAPREDRPSRTSAASTAVEVAKMHSRDARVAPPNRAPCGPWPWSRAPPAWGIWPKPRWICGEGSEWEGGRGGE